MADGVLCRCGDECGVCAADVEGDAPAGAKAEADVPGGDAVVVDDLPDAAAIAGVRDYRRAHVCGVLLLLDDVGISAAHGLWLRAWGGGDLWCGRCGGRAGRSVCRTARGPAWHAVRDHDRGRCGDRLLRLVVGAGKGSRVSGDAPPG